MSKKAREQKELRGIMCKPFRILLAELQSQMKQEKQQKMVAIKPSDMSYCEAFLLGVEASLDELEKKEKTR